MTPAIHLVECPRDAFQGLPHFIPTDEKVAHLVRIVAAGVREIDFGSFVSPKAVPQMADSDDVLRQFIARIDADRMPRLIAIIANERGLERAAATGVALSVGYPLSLAETFQRNNTGRSIDESWPLVESLQRRCEKAGLDLIVYISMAFGNPDGEPWSAARVADFAARLAGMGVRTISLADTVGRATPPQVSETFAAVFARLTGSASVPARNADHSPRSASVPARTNEPHPTTGVLDTTLPDGIERAVAPPHPLAAPLSTTTAQGAAKNSVTVGAHFHAAPGRWSEVVRAAYDAGCRRFDAALGGLGGCPFAQDSLVGNIPTEGVVAFFESAGIQTGINRTELAGALQSASAIQQEFGHE